MTTLAESSAEFITKIQDLLNDVSTVSVVDINNFLNKCQKEDKSTLKKIKYKLQTQLLVINQKLQTLMTAVSFDEDNIKNRFRLHQTQTVVKNYEESLQLIHLKILSFEQNGWQQLTPLQQDELHAFEKSLRTSSAEQLIRPYFRTIKSARIEAQKEFEHYSNMKKDVNLAPEELATIIEKRETARNNHIYLTFQLRQIEMQWFQCRIAKVATLPTFMHDETDSFYYSLKHLREEKLIFLKSQYQTKRQINNSRKNRIEFLCQINSIAQENHRLMAEWNTLMHSNMQISIYLSDITLELNSRNITTPKRLSKPQRIESPTSVVRPVTPFSLMKTIEKNEQNLGFSYKTAKITVLFSNKDASQENIPPRPMTPGFLCIT